jgi:hypothetical protein
MGEGGSGYSHNPADFVGFEPGMDLARLFASDACWSDPK